MKFARYLQRKREAAGLTQNQLDRSARLGAGETWQIEHGNVVQPFRKTVLKLARVLDLEPNESLLYAGLAPDLNPEIVSEAAFAYHVSQLEPNARKAVADLAELEPDEQLLVSRYLDTLIPIFQPQAS